MLTNIKVVSSPGKAAIGEMYPAIGMPTDKGYVSATGVSTITIGGTGAASGYYLGYADRFNIASGDAAAFGWPSSGGSIQYGHDGGVNSGGSPTAGFQMGFTYQTGGSASTGGAPASGQYFDILR